MSKQGPEAEVMDRKLPLGSHNDPKHRGNIVLVPQPSDDPDDPLNWSQRKKYSILGILCLTAFSGLASSLANQLGLGAQAELYDKSLTELSYTISAAVAGIAAGPLFIVPLAHVFGRASIIFWTLIGCICCGIWSALMTGPNDYVAFTLSRLFGGIFGSIPSILGPQMLMELFFLHERGRVFTTFHMCFLMGTVAGPTFGGFVVQHVAWPFEFWWTVALQNAVALLVFFFLPEIGFTRDGGRVYPKQPEGYVANRIATFFPGTRVAHRDGLQEAPRSAIAQLLIGASPVGLLAGTYTFGFFGWFVSVNTLLTVFLQEPTEDGGYGFTPQQNAGFSFALWLGVIVAQIWGSMFNDRIPLMCARRAGGIWKPEYRFHSLWIPSVLFMPVGLGIFGSALQYHLHYMVLALGSFLITIAAFCSIPVAVNYLMECFRDHPTEVACIMGTYRLTLGLIVPFFVDQWIARVGGPGWVFGMMAFFSLFAFSLVIILMFFGHSLRQIHLGRLSKDEEGMKVTDMDSD
ncbi:major facilitator superfamily domain-containing protein [Penicillium riverlandense]|uniref:major facilitator superfamily domain-containing protein n=1 Tax=Penicillium riverlandense TaxID=1903569 RepID=UPI00254663F4|nr:major facilitator superfamily domain-containing protein [Penicillium riverlandense]KAJ5812383.1 major facilitator superfamily domain-containing protein [Penicillium riverlandense]